MIDRCVRKSDGKIVYCEIYDHAPEECTDECPLQIICEVPTDLDLEEEAKKMAEMVSDNIDNQTSKTLEEK